MNVLSMEFVRDGDTIHHKGNMFVSGSVGKNATVIVTSGSLTIEGDIGKSTTIELRNRPEATPAIASRISLAGIISPNHATVKLTVKGCIKNHACIVCDIADIVANDVESGASIHAKMGSIQIKNEKTPVSLNAL